MSTQNRRKRWRCVWAVCLVGLVAAGVSCSGTKAGPAAASPTSYRDGEYEGSSFKFPARMRVAVKIEQGRIADIRIVKHFGPEKHERMVHGVISDILSKQVTDVDDVTGATVSSRALKRAVSDALGKATGE